MDEFSVLIGGKAGDGIDKAGLVISYILNRLGYSIYIYREYPSIIRGGHTFSIIRASKRKVFAHTDSVDVLLAMNKETVESHIKRLKPVSAIVYEPKTTDDAVTTLGPDQKELVVPVSTIIEEEDAPPVTANSVMIGALAKVLGIKWNVLEEVFRKKLLKATEKNLSVARRGYDEVETCFQVSNLNQDGLPLLTGNEVLGLGLVKGGLNTYIAYPMTPTSNVLHFMAANADNFGLKVIHAESEIGVILMALGCAYTGESVAVGTSGGGFCLMTEGYSLAAMAELPIVVVLGQRPGPSTGLPTYSSQTELNFALNAGHGEFTRFVIAPGDGEESYFWAQIALFMAAKYMIPVIILTDKNLGEGTYSFEESSADEAVFPELPVRDRKKVFKINSYEHDENGITTEDPDISKSMQDKRLAKTRELAKELDGYSQVGIYGNSKSKMAILCWGSNKGVCVEVARSLDLKVIQPIVMSPFPARQFKEALSGVEKLIAVESNATGQLAKLIVEHGFHAGESVLKYDGRAYSVDDLQAKLTTIIEGQKP